MKGLYMSEKYNAKCDICGKPYKICRSCQEIKSFQAWRTVTDTLPHYMIFLALTEYSRTKDKDKARIELSNCDLSEKESFNENIKSVINEIFKEDEKKSENVKKDIVSPQNKTPQIKKVMKDVKTKNENNIE